LAGGGAVTRLRIAYWVIGGAVVLLALACLGVEVPLHGAFLFAFGWVSFLSRVVPQIKADASSAATGAIALLLLVVGLHWFLCWLSAAIVAGHTVNATAATGDSTTASPLWRLRWTASIVAIVLMMFVAGVSMVGMIHEVAWLASSPVVIFSSGARDAARRMQSSNNLRQLSSGAQKYQSSHYGLLPEIINDDRGEAIHGWLTAILPSIDPDTYGQIDMSQPWNSGRNADAMKRRVRAYQIPNPNLPTKNAAGFELSHYAANVHVLGGKRPPSSYEITDGASNTLLIGEAAGNYRPWGHPHNYRDPMLGINKSPDGFGSPWPTGAVFSFADGHTKFISDNIDPQVLRALSTPAGGEKVGDY